MGYDIDDLNLINESRYADNDCDWNAFKAVEDFIKELGE